MTELIEDVLKPPMLSDTQAVVRHEQLLALRGAHRASLAGGATGSTSSGHTAVRSGQSGYTYTYIYIYIII